MLGKLNFDFVCVKFDWIQSENEIIHKYHVRNTLYMYKSGDLLRHLLYQLLHKHIYSVRLLLNKNNRNR